MRVAGGEVTKLPKPAPPTLTLFLEHTFLSSQVTKLPWLRAELEKSIQQARGRPMSLWR